MGRHASLFALLMALALSWPVQAREQCPFIRDPAFWARTPVAPAAEGELAIATQNLYRLFDDVQDGHEKTLLTAAQFAARIDRIARYIARDLATPQLLAIQEVEDATSLDALVKALRRETGREYRYIAGETSGDSDIRSALLFDARLAPVSSESLFARSPRAGKPLHDRLPLVVDIDAGAQGRLTLVIVHLKSMRGLERDSDAERVAEKRRFQSAELATWVREQQASGRRLVVLGDFNATVLDTDAARAEPMRLLLDGSGLVDVAGRFLKPTQRWTYRYRCQLNELDHVLVSPALSASVSGYAISRGDTCIRVKEKCDATRSVSDHDGVMLRLR